MHTAQSRVLTLHSLLFGVLLLIGGHAFGLEAFTQDRSADQPSKVAASLQRAIARPFPRHYAEILRLVQSARVAGMPIELRVTERVAMLPGLLTRLRSLRECAVYVLPRGAAALGALEHESAIRRTPDTLALIYQLPIASTAAGGIVSPRSTPVPPSSPQPVSKGTRSRQTKSRIDTFLSPTPQRPPAFRGWYSTNRCYSLQGDFEQAWRGSSTW